MIREDQELRFLKQWKQDGNWRIRFRRDGYKEVELKVPRGYRGDKATLSNSQDFLAAYLAANSQPVAEIAAGEKRAAYGSALRRVSGLARFYPGRSR